jgi:Acetoacetate decarboxylase (ADC)
VMNLRNLPWLAGRGYNTTGVYLNNIVHGSSGRRGSILSVLFESLTDPITTGREELGFPKVFATTTDPIKSDDGTWEYKVSWLGHEFMHLTFPDVKQNEPPAMRPFAHSSPSIDGHFAYRYIPAVGRPGVADAEYAVFKPGSTKPDKINAFYSPGRTADIKIAKSSFEQLPTLHYIVNRLAAIPLKEVREQCIIDQQEASDVAHVIRL